MDNKTNDMDNLKHDSAQHKLKKDNKNSSFFKRWLVNIGYDCPHRDCGQHFFAPINSKGVLFCPHCQQSILLKPTDTYTDKSTQKSGFQFQWQVLTKPTYWLLSFMMLLLFLYMKWSNNGNIIFLFFTFIIAISFVYLIIKGISAKGKQDYLFSFTHYNKPVYAGIDKLAEMDKYPFGYVIANGQLAINQPANQDIFTSYETIYFCPCCHSQQMINLTSMLVLDFKFFEKYNIPRPKNIPKSNFDPVTRTYADATKYTQVVCLNCLSYFKWQAPSKPKTPNSFYGFLQKIKPPLIQTTFFVLHVILYGITALFILPKLIMVTAFYLMNGHSILSLALFTPSWWQTLLLTLVKSILAIIFFQFLFFFYMTIAMWLRSNSKNNNKVTLQKIKMDY